MGNRMKISPFIIYWKQRADYSCDYVIVDNDMANVPADVVAAQHYQGYDHIPTPEQIARAEQCGSTVTIKVHDDIHQSKK